MSIENLVILYVEDDKFSRRVVEIMVKEILQIKNLFMFDDSIDFLARVEALPAKPDIIFLDIQMQPLDGFEMLKLLKDHPSYRDTTTVALTANVMAHDVKRLQDIGFDGLIGKPLLENVFPTLLADIVNGQDVWFVP